MTRAPVAARPADETFLAGVREALTAAGLRPAVPGTARPVVVPLEVPGPHPRAVVCWQHQRGHFSGEPMPGVDLGLCAAALHRAGYTVESVIDAYGGYLAVLRKGRF